MSESRLTVSEAAEQLGIHEKRLRRLLQRSEYRDRTETAERETRTGTRLVTVIPSPLLTDLRSRLEMEKNGDNGDADRDKDTQRERQTRTGTGTALVVTAYERIIEEKDRRIDELHAALEHERQQSRDLLEALKREQALRALPPGEKPLQANENGSAERANEDGSVPPPPTIKRPWWQVWKR